MRKLLELPVMQEWLIAMESDNPVNKTAPRGVTAEDACIMLGEQTGWANFRNRFLMGGAKIEKLAPPPEQNYLRPADQQ